MNKTKIPWVKNPDDTQGYTWNPITGCLNHTNGMCKGGNFPCFAYRLAHGRLKSRYLANGNVVSPAEKERTKLETLETIGKLVYDPFYPRLWEDRLKDSDLHKHREPRGVFTCDMSDLFGIGIPELWTRKVMAVIKYCEYDRFYLLTKQPQNLAKFSPFPENCWVGVTATNAEACYNACEYLGKVDAAVKYLSLEPLLNWESQEQANIVRWLQLGMWVGKGGINWLIIGAQTRPYKPPQVEWVEEIVKAADKAGVPIFLKDNLWVNEREPLRQEMPNG